MSNSFFIQVYDAPSGNVRRARDSRGNDLPCMNLITAVRKVAKWQDAQADKRDNGEAVRHTYSVHAEEDMGEASVLVCL